MPANSSYLNAQTPNNDYVTQNTSRKVAPPHLSVLPIPGDSLREWMDSYQTLAVVGARSEAVAQKITLHLSRFHDFFRTAYGHDRLSACLRRDVLAWQKHLRDTGMAASTVNNHLASLSAFTTWVLAHKADVFPLGDPTKGIGELALPPLEPR